MKAKQYIISLIFFLIGFTITIIGALFKIQHWPYGSEILTLGMLFQFLTVVILLVKFYNQKSKESL